MTDYLAYSYQLPNIYLWGSKYNDRRYKENKEYDQLITIFINFTLVYLNCNINFLLNMTKIIKGDNTLNKKNIYLCKMCKPNK